MKLKQYILNILIAFDQLINALILGQPNETISSRAWRCKDTSSFWKFMRKLVDTLFFWQKDHCYNSFIYEIKRNKITTTILTKNK